MKIKIIPIVFALIFFIASFFTLSHYGISWDETLHFRRGQAYLYYFLTGQTDYQKLPELRRSFYQNDENNGKYFIEQDSGHPPLNGELAALTNYVFFQKLGWIDDIAAHHLFNILAASLLVFIVTSFALEVFGIFASIISFLALATYPLFWAESHFNIKDPPEAAFFAGTIWAFYKSLQKGNSLWLLASLLFFALAIGTKFNIFFLPFIVIPYLLIYYRKFLAKPIKSLKLIPKKYLLVLLAGPLIVGLIFFSTWPYLWHNFPANLLSIFGYYKEIGTNFRYQPDNFYVMGFNFFPVLWILFTTPPIVLVLSGIGIIALFIKHTKQKMVGILWLLWFLVPIARVSMPNTTIYGGIRQIMEFLPALTLLTGLGAWQLLQWVKNSNKYRSCTILVQFGLIACFIWPFVVLVKLHPYENVYFNSLIGGLRGAQERNFPSWGNTFGSVYFQGAQWLDANAEKNAKLSLIQGTTGNVPSLWLRPDINYQNSNWSGINRGEEYLMDLAFNDTVKVYYYAWEYIDKFLDPVYEIKSDGVPILKIWKNDFDHTKSEMKKMDKDFMGYVKTLSSGNVLSISLDRKVELSRIQVTYPSVGCSMEASGFIETSPNGVNWRREEDTIPSAQVGRKSNISKDGIVFFFASRETKYIRLIFGSQQFCGLINPQVKIRVLE